MFLTTLKFHLTCRQVVFYFLLITDFSVPDDGSLSFLSSLRTPWYVSTEQLCNLILRKISTCLFSFTTKLSLLLNEVNVCGIFR